MRDDPSLAETAQCSVDEAIRYFSLSGSGYILKNARPAELEQAALDNDVRLAEIALRAGTEEPHPELFHYLRDALDRRADPSDNAADTALAALWGLIALVGFQPEMTNCVRCGRPHAVGPVQRRDQPLHGAHGPLSGVGCGGRVRA